MAYVPPLNGGRINATISGNTAGAGALISTGTLALAGGNNITLSQNSNSISISAPAISSVNAAGIVNISSNGSNVTISAPAFSAGIASNSTVSNQMILTAGNNITLSQSTNATGATVTVSAASQTNQTLGFYGTGGTFNNTTLTADARSLSFSGMGNVSVGYSNGMVQISGSGGGGGIALANSQTTYTSGTANLLEGGGAITIASTTGQKFNVSVPATSSLSATGAFSIATNGSTISMGVPAFSIGISSTLGNTAGTTGTVSNQLILAGGNNITLSQSTGAGGNTLSIVGPNTVAQSNQSISFIASGANTFGTSSSARDARSVSISGMGAVSLGFSTDSVLRISAPAQSAQTQSLIQALYDGANSITTGTVRLSNANGISFGINGQNITASHNAITSQTNQAIAFTAGTTGGGNTLLTSTGTFDARSMFLNAYGMVSAGFSSSSMFLSATQSVQTQNLMTVNGTQGNVSISGGANITVGNNASTITISAAAQSNQSISFIASGANTFGTSSSARDARSVSMSGAGALSLGFSTDSVLRISAPAQSTLSATGALSISTVGSTISIGAPAVSSLVGTGIVSLSTNGSTVSISAPAFSAGMGTAGNTAGNSSLVTNQLYLVGSNNITLSQTTGAGGATLSIIGGAGGGGGGTITAGGTTFTNGVSFTPAGALTFSGSNSTLTMSVPAQSTLSATGALSISTVGSTISIGAPAVSLLSGTGGINISSNGSTVSIGAPMLTQHIHNSAGMYFSGTAAITNNSATVVRMFIPNAISFTRADLPVSISVATAANNSTSPINISRTAVIYTRNGSTLTPIAGGTNYGQYTFSSNNTASVAGAKVVSVPVATTLAAGEYYLGVQLASAVTSIGGATTNLGWTIAPVFGSYQQPVWDYMNVTTALTNNAFQPMQGLISSGITNTTQTLQQSIISQGSTYGNAANLVVMFKNDYIGE